MNINASASMGGIYNAYLPIDSNANNESSINIPIVLSVAVLSGDINFDEIVNILDVVQLVNQILFS